MWMPDVPHDAHRSQDPRQTEDLCHERLRGAPQKQDAQGDTNDGDDPHERAETERCGPGMAEVRCFHNPMNWSGIEARELSVPAKTVGTPNRRTKAGIRYSPPATPRRPERMPSPKPSRRPRPIWSRPKDKVPPAWTSNKINRRPVAERIPARRPLRAVVESRFEPRAPTNAPGRLVGTKRRASHKRSRSSAHA